MGAETDSFARAAVVDVATVVGIADVVDDDVAGDAVVGSVVPGAFTERGTNELLARGAPEGGDGRAVAWRGV